MSSAFGGQMGGCVPGAQGFPSAQAMHTMPGPGVGEPTRAGSADTHLQANLCQHAGVRETRGAGPAISPLPHCVTLGNRWALPCRSPPPPRLFPHHMENTTCPSLLSKYGEDGTVCSSQLCSAPTGTLHEYHVKYKENSFLKIPSP